jgi:hypothetical protein
MAAMRKLTLGELRIDFWPLMTYCSMSFTTVRYWPAAGLFESMAITRAQK